VVTALLTGRVTHLGERVPGVLWMLREIISRSPRCVTRPVSSAVTTLPDYRGSVRSAGGERGFTQPKVQCSALSVSECSCLCSITANVKTNAVKMPMKRKLPDSTQSTSYRSDHELFALAVLPVTKQRFAVSYFLFITTHLLKYNIFIIRRKFRD